MATIEMKAGRGTGDARVDEAPASPSDAHIRTLLSRMGSQREVLRAILEACDEPRTIDQVKDMTRAMRERHRSVYGVDALCLQLERAGALERVLASGAPYGEISDGVATEVIDGVSYLVRKDPPTAYWHTTQAGRAALAARGASAELESLLERDTRLIPVYREVLAMCARDGGAKMDDVVRAIDDDPLCQSPRLYAAHFIDNLEACGAVTWGPPWIATEVGLQGLAALDDGKTMR